MLSVINDHLGTPKELINQWGQVEWSASPSKAWGLREKRYGTNHRARCPIRFQGQWEDEETGLCCNYYRYYDPDVGRFISQDPIGLAGGTNLYAYGPNPLSWIDPLGLACGPAVRQNSRGQWIDARGRFAKAPNVAALPRFKGRSIRQIQRILVTRGYTRTNPANPKNQRWQHPDGSEVQIHAYGGQTTGPYKAGNNAHAHKSLGRHGSPGTTELADNGITAVSTHSSDAHIGIRNPADFPTVSGRAHGR